MTPEDVHPRDLYEHWYERIRYETTLFPCWDLVSLLQYGLKYARKKRSAHSDLLRYFSRSADHRPPDGPPPAVLHISMVGDIMWMRSGWDTFLSREIGETLSRSDVVLGNLETPVSRGHRVISWLPDLLWYNSPPVLLDQLARCFTALSVVNNHSLDQGVVGLHSTLRELDARGILHAGAGDPPYAVIRTGAGSIGFLAYGWGLNGHVRPAAGASGLLTIMNLCDPSGPVDLSMVEEHISRARQDGAELIVCSLHWGHEYELFPTWQMMRTARDLIVRGVDVIMGHHPHVLQPVEMIDVNADRAPGLDNVEDRADPAPRKAVIAYSLGNFVSAMLTRECRRSAVCTVHAARLDGRLRVAGFDLVPITCERTDRRERGPVVLPLRE